MVKFTQHSFKGCGIILLGMILFGTSPVFAADRQHQPDTAGDTAKLAAERDYKRNLQDITTYRKEAIDELVSFWVNDEPGWGEDFRAVLNTLNDRKLWLVYKAETYDEILTVLGVNSGPGTNVPLNDPGSPPNALGSTTEDFLYTPVDPCRIFDTRDAGGKIGSNSFRNFRVHGTAGQMTAQGGNSAGCTAPKGEPRAVHINIVAVDSINDGYLTVWPKGGVKPLAGVLNYSPTAKTDPISNAFTVVTGYLQGDDISVFAYRETHVVADVLGYYYEGEPETVAAIASSGTLISTIAVGSGYTTLASKTVTIPANGYVLLMGEASWYNANSNYLGCRFREDTTLVDFWWWEAGDSDAYVDNHQSRFYMHPATPGTKTYDLQCYRSGGTGATAYYRNLTVQFIGESM